MIMLNIISQAKSYSPKAEWQGMCDEQRFFADLPEAKAWLEEKYGTCKRQPMYVDGKDGERQQIGWVYGFRNADWSHAPVENWLQNDWVEVSEVKRVELD